MKRSASPLQKEIRFRHGPTCTERYMYVHISSCSPLHCVFQCSNDYVNNKPILLSKCHRHIQSYRCLIDVAKDCFKTLLLEHKESSNAEKKSRERADRILNLHKDLDYSQSSFMNLFNYNYGLLAPHRDRCLVTVVYTHTNPSVNTEPLVSDEVKNLWCLKPGETESEIKSWQSIDSLVVSPERQHSVCLHVGEELSALCEHRLPAALHCVQVDPTRVETPTSHKTPNASNRLSAALILSSDDISAIVEDELL